MRFFRSTFFVLIMSLFIISCGQQPADLVFRNGKIATVDENFSYAEAVAIKGEKFIFVGDNTGIEEYIGDNTEVIDLNGKLAVPGLIDAHGHLPGLGQALENLDFVGTTSFQQILNIVENKVRTVQPGEWILGRGWDQNDWDNKQFPNHDALSRISPDNPVFLTRIDGHAAIANAKAMELAGINSQTSDPEGGKIYHKSNGNPTGVLIDIAMDLVSEKIPPLSVERRRETLIKAAEACLSVGLVSMHDAGVGTDIIEDYKYLIEQDKFPFRVYAMISDPGLDDLDTFLKTNYLPDFKNHYLSARSVKMLADGALGSRGAAFLEDYSDDPGNTGLLTASYERMAFVSKAALRSGYQVNIHAIGDRGNRLVLNAFEEALKEYPTDDHRFRNEHSQIIALEDFPRFKELGVIPSMQPTHATSDMYWAQDRVGPERIKGAYSWRTLINDGNIIPCGSDFPVESHNPMLGFYAAITRQDKDGWPEGGWQPEQRMTREETLKGFTIWAAYSAFQEDVLGSVEVGKFADLTVLSKDILTVEPKEILTTEPVYTVVGGKIRFPFNK
ncbi:amidohydrolase [candidate division KSB1 bacterium]